jgi:hypothetical protein
MDKDTLIDNFLELIGYAAIVLLFVIIGIVLYLHNEALLALRYGLENQVCVSMPGFG